MRGILLINKEKGYTSFDVVAILRKILHEKRIGHGGTLDPNAEGVLPVFIGNVTRALDLIERGDKEYVAELFLGRSTDTEDIYGNTLLEAPVNVSEETIRETIQSFLGSYDQVPPMYSAKKVDGRKLYQLAREGKDVLREPARVEILELEILKVELPKVTFRAVVSKGTYIRSLCRDIGERLGVPACMSALLRTRHGDFSLKQAHTLKEVREMAEEGRIGEWILPLETAFPSWRRLTVTEEGAFRLKNGNTLMPCHFLEDTAGILPGVSVLVFGNGRFQAIYQRRNEQEFKGVKMFPEWTSEAGEPQASDR